LLLAFFGNTIAYDRVLVCVNSELDQSFTPGYFPTMALNHWAPDYSVASIDKGGYFLHEMVHVWQTQHGSHNVLRGAYLLFRYRFN